MQQQTSSPKVRAPGPLAAALQQRTGVQESAARLQVATVAANNYHHLMHAPGPWIIIIILPYESFHIILRIKRYSTFIYQDRSSRGAVAILRRKLWWLEDSAF